MIRRAVARESGVPKFAANLSMLFTELPFLDRIAAAAAAGFDAVECQFPYEQRADEIAHRLEDNQMAMVLHNLPAGDWGAGDRGIAALPERRSEFRDGVAKAIEYARALNCPRLNCLAGIVEPGRQAEAHEALVDNLRFVTAALEEACLELLIEPVNTRDTPGFLVCHSQQAIAIIDAVGAPNFRLQFDLYHAQIMEGDLARSLETLLPRIGHIQIADNPGRHEPGTGEINYAFLFKHLDTQGYDGWVGCEYRPLTTTADGLGWLARHRAEIR